MEPVDGGSFLECNKHFVILIQFTLFNDIFKEKEEIGEFSKGINW